MPRKLGLWLTGVVALACADTRVQAPPEGTGGAPSAGAAGTGVAGASGGAAGAAADAGDAAAGGPGTQRDAAAGSSSGGAGGSGGAAGAADAASAAFDAGAPTLTACDTAPCDPEEATCAMVAGEPVCTCAPGYRDVLGDGALCEGIDECASGAARCVEHATCINTPAAYVCVCDPGFHGEGLTGCEPNAACTSPGVDPCGDPGYCMQIDGGPDGLCACGWDAEWDGQQCNSLEQCARGLDDCHGQAQCDEDAYLFGCTCPAGYLGDGHGDAGCFLPASRPTVPRIPEPGDAPCPTFEVGTSSHPELLGASFIVGPKSTGPDAPLLFYWHGTGSTAGEVEGLLPAAIRQEIVDAGGILVSFDTSTGTGGDCSGTGVFAKDDLDVADRVVACAVRDHNIDPRRIYVTGCSSGGLQAGCMGVLRSSYVAAVATNSGGLMKRETMQSAHAPATFTMYGPSALIIIEFGPLSRQLTDEVQAFGADVVDCDHGGSHCGAPEELYLEAWEFMKAHPFDVTDAAYDPALRPAVQTHCR